MHTCIALAGLLLCSAAAAGAVQESKVPFESGGKTIGMEMFAPEMKGDHPVVLVLHGSDGLGGPTAMGYRTLCRGLAERGYIALLPHYFERTDTRRGNATDNVKHFAAWMQTVQDAIEKAKGIEGAAGEKVELVGFSLGAFLSLSVSTRNKDVAAVVEFFGGLPVMFAANAKGMPPVLILHGDADAVVPVKQAHDLEAVLKRNSVPYEVKIYAGQGHGFTGEARVDSMKRAEAFLEKHADGKKP